MPFRGEGGISIGKEIERKFLLNYLPDNLEVLSTTYITQQYLAIGNEEVRIRHKLTEYEDEYVMTIKTGSGLEREEREFPILLGTYGQLIRLGDKFPINKVRRLYMLDKMVVSVDTFKDPSNIPDLIEVEFSSTDQAASFKIPEWFGKEVTDDKTYKNQNIWNKTN